MYDPIKDLQPITVVAVTCYAIAVNPSVPAQTLNELVAYAKANPGKLSYGSAGAGSVNHLTGELLKSLIGNRKYSTCPIAGQDRQSPTPSADRFRL